VYVQIAFQSKYVAKKRVRNTLNANSCGQVSF
jgi:hypothetical protein